MNLALCLLGTRRPLSKRELRGSIEAYMEAGNDESFNRMFERDKDDLRELGLVIETVENLEGETGYLARRDSNRLPPVSLDAEEAAAWDSPRRSGSRPGSPARQRRPAEAARRRDAGGGGRYAPRAAPSSRASPSTRRPSSR